MTSYDLPDSFGLQPLLDTIPAWERKDCACGHGDDYWGSKARHAKAHMLWERGLDIPRGVYLWDTVHRVTAESSRSQRKLAYDMGEVFRREQHYDFPLVPHPNHWQEAPTRAVYLVLHDSHVIALLIADTAKHWGRWDWSPGVGVIKFTERTPTPLVVGIFVARAYRRLGIASRLSQYYAKQRGCTVPELAWGFPLSTEGRHLIEHLTPEEVRVQ